MMARSARATGMGPTVTLGPWPLGIDNGHRADHAVYEPRFDPSEPRPAMLRAALDVDLDDSGWPRSRPRASLIQARAEAEGEWGLAGRRFSQIAGELYQDWDAEATALVTGLVRRAELVEHAGLIFGSDGATHFEIEGTTVRNWGLPVPTLALTLGGAGALEKSRTYLVQAAFSDARGNEGGASVIYAHTMTAAGAIEVLISGFTADCASVNLYAGDAEQDATSFVAKATIVPDEQEDPEAPPTMTYSLTAVNVTAADPPKTDQMTGPFAGLTGLCSFRAFLLAFRDNFVVRSEAQEPHLFHPDNIMQFPADVTACEGLVSGLWVGTAAGLCWVAGEGPESWIPAQKSFAAVASGSYKLQGDKLKGLQTSEPVALFVTADGLVAGLPGGILVNLTDDRYTFDATTRASFAYVERGDLRQLLIALIGD